MDVRAFSRTPSTDRYTQWPLGFNSKLFGVLVKPKHSPESRGPDNFCSEAVSDEYDCALQHGIAEIHRFSLHGFTILGNADASKTQIPCRRAKCLDISTYTRRYEDGLINLRCNQNCKSRGSQRHAGKARLGIAHVEGHVLLAQRLNL